MTDNHTSEYEYGFDLTALWKLFIKQPGFNEATEKINITSNENNIEVGFIEFTINQNLNQVIVDRLNLASYNITYPFFGERLIKDIDNLIDAFKSSHYNYDYYVSKSRDMLFQWESEISPTAMEKHKLALKQAFEENIEFYTRSSLKEMNLLYEKNRINIELGQNELAFVFMLFLGDSAFSSNRIKPAEYNALMDHFSLHFNFKDKISGEYKEINKEVFLKKISEVRTSERDKDAMKNDFNHYFDSLF